MLAWLSLFKRLNLRAKYSVKGQSIGISTVSFSRISEESVHAWYLTWFLYATTYCMAVVMMQQWLVRLLITVHIVNSLEEGFDHYTNTWMVELHDTLEKSEVSLLAQELGLVNRGNVSVLKLVCVWGVCM